MKIKSDDDLPSIADVEASALLGKKRGYVLLANRRSREFSITSMTANSGGKSVPPTLAKAIRLTHRKDLPLPEAMQDTGRCERNELPATEPGAVTLPPYSITRLEFAHPWCRNKTNDKGATEPVRGAESYRP